jgi:hypothetical protein
MKKILVALAMAMLMGVVGSAAVTPCTQANGSAFSGNLALSVGTQFKCGADLYTILLINPTGDASSATLTLDTNTASPAMSGIDNATGIETLSFIIGGLSTNGLGKAGDIQLEYYETGSVVNGLDLNFQAHNDTGNGNITISESGCSVQLVLNVCPSSALINFGGAGTSTANGGNGNSVQKVFPMNNPPGVTSAPLYIFKDISFTNAFMSEFSNSTDTFVPEPVTVLLIGGGLLGLGLLKKFKKA